MRSAVMDNWIRGAAVRHTITPISHTKSSPRVVGKLLLIISPYSVAFGVMIKFAVCFFVCFLYG